MMNKFLVKRILWLGVMMAVLPAFPVFADNPESFSWTGPYVGIFVGGMLSNFSNASGGAGASGSDGSSTVGGDIGYNWQINRLVLGAEGDIAAIDTNSTSAGTKFTENWMSTLRGRLGYSFGRFLPYVTAGLGFTGTNAKLDGVGSDSSVQTGFAGGVGVDADILGNFFTRAEYLYVDVPNENSTISGTTISGGSGNNIIRLGVGYKF